MWVTTPTLLPLLPTTTTTTATFPRRRLHRTTTVTATTSPEEVTGLGQTVLTTKGPNPNPKPGGGGVEIKAKELNGSDILWALQKASAKKAKVNTFNKKKNVVKNGSGARLKTGNTNRVDGFDKARPIVVKSDWVTRLDDLDQRLHEFLNL